MNKRVNRVIRAFGMAIVSVMAFSQICWGNDGAAVGELNHVTAITGFNYRGPDYRDGNVDVTAIRDEAGAADGVVTGFNYLGPDYRGGDWMAARIARIIARELNVK